MESGLIALILVLCVIIAAIISKKCAECMIVGSIVASVICFGPNFASEWVTSLQNCLADNVWVVLVCGLFGSLIALLQASRGTLGFQKLVTKLCNSDRKTLLTTVVMGILIFVDDYLNVMTIGVCMKKTYDDRKLPRESLAYILDSTGAPVCVLLPFSTWAAFYASLFYEQESVADLGYSTAMSTYIHAIPYMLYPIFALIIVFLFAMGVMPKLGAMKKAYKRVETTGKVYSDASAKYNHDEYQGYEQSGKLMDFLIPMIVMIAVCLITSDVLIAVFIAIIVCAFLYIPRKVVPASDFFNVLVKGFADMLSILMLLVCSFVLSDMLDNLGLTEYIIETAEPFLTANIFPVVIFVIVAALCFCTGSLWGLSAIVTPIVFPLGAALGANPLLIMAAVVSGATFGSHACFYTDCTLLSSMSACIDNMEHALSQFPYVLIGAILSAVGFGILGFVV